MTCKDSRDLAIEAAEKGADYVAFGAFFRSSTKITNVTASKEILNWWSETTNVPCVAIGGITPNNCGPLVNAGAHYIAVSSAVWKHANGPTNAILEFEAKNGLFPDGNIDLLTLEALLK